MKKVLKPGFSTEPRKLSVKGLSNSSQCYVSDWNDNYLWPDGTINNGYRWYFQDEAQAARALQAYAQSAIDWLTREEVLQEAQRGPLEAIQCSVLHWQQIQAAGLQGYTDANHKGLVNASAGFCSMCKRYFSCNDRCTNCPLGAEYKLDKLVCFKEYRSFIITEKTSETDFQEQTGAIIRRLQAHEMELLEATKKPEPVTQHFRLGDVARTMPSGNIYINTANPEKPWQLIRIKNPTACAKLGLNDHNIWPPEVFANVLDLLGEAKNAK